MPPKDRVERQLEHLKSLKAAGRSDEAIGELRKALQDKVNVIVAKAAGIADEWGACGLEPDLVSAFERLFVKPVESDPKCWGKTALAKALKNCEVADSAIFLRGLRHIQMEPVWGRKEDSAGTLRGTCALALVQCTDLPRDQILLHLLDSLTDAHPSVRSDAARALEQMGGRDVSLVLRLKARLGDEEVRITGQILEALLQLEGSSGVPFVVGFISETNEDVNDEAALALGASRMPEALAALLSTCQQSKGRRNETALLRAISASRLEPALAFLLEQIRSARLHVAEEALRALELHRDSPPIVERVEQAVAQREELQTLFYDKFRRE